ncbi:MAG: hypothetical protein ACLQU2_23100 [Candidatus Binataceae bacterium]
MNTASNISLDQIYRSPPELLEMLTAVLKDGGIEPRRQNRALAAHVQ